MSSLSVATLTRNVLGCCCDLEMSVKKTKSGATIAMMIILVLLELSCISKDLFFSLEFLSQWMTSSDKTSSARTNQIKIDLLQFTSASVSQNLTLRN